MTDQVTFSFGKNWFSFTQAMPDSAIEDAHKDIVDWVGDDGVMGKSVVDVGCGSGLSSYCFHRLGASTLRSLDADPWSIKSTKLFKERAGNPDNWTVEEGSILDTHYLQTLPKADLVYSWGVLHHTGDMWRAIKQTTHLVAPGGRLWLTLYHKGPNYENDLALKKQYNRASNLGKKWMIRRYILDVMRKRIQRKQNPFSWNQRKRRGMDTYHDIVDWLGGLPYEVCSPEEVIEYLTKNGFNEIRVDRCKWEGQLNGFLFEKT